MDANGIFVSHACSGQDLLLNLLLHVCCNDCACVCVCVCVCCVCVCVCVCRFRVLFSQFTLVYSSLQCWGAVSFSFDQNVLLNKRI